MPATRRVLPLLLVALAALPAAATPEPVPAHGLPMRHREATPTPAPKLSPQAGPRPAPPAKPHEATAEPVPAAKAQDATPKPPATTAAPRIETRPPVPEPAAPAAAKAPPATPPPPAPKAAGAAGSRIVLPPIAFEKYTLANGLEVVLHEDHSTPLVAVDIWYHVGSKNERPGRTGFAHLFEHMMFQGSKHQDNDYFKPIQEAGGTINGSTNTDRTNYFEVVPANFLERALYMEADRMGFLLDAMTQKKLDNQRDVVKNEKRQRLDNEPYGRAWELLAEAAYPAKHPYSWLTIGSMEDLTAASLDDVKDFFRRFYTPSNATLVVAGDFAPADARRMIEAYFGALPPGAPVWKFEAWTPRFEGERRIEMQDRVQLPRTYMLWHAAPLFAPDDAALDVLSQVLGGGKASRLYDALVHEKSLAQDATAANDSREIAGSFRITATARPGVAIDAVEREIDAQVERIRRDGPTAAELEQARNTIEATFISGLENVRGVADQLNLYNHYLGTPDGFQRDLDRYRAVTVERVRDVARRYLVPERLVLRVVPMPPLQPSDSADARGVDRATLPAGGPVPDVKLPQPTRLTLGNGLDVVVIEQHELPVLSFSLVLPGGGAAADPAGKPGLANLTAQMLDEGTTGRKALDIARDLDRIGAHLDLSVDADAAAASLWTLKSHAGEALDLLADVVSRPSFPGDELERVRKQLLTRLLQEKDQPNAISGRSTARVLYGDPHPYGHPELGSEDLLRQATREDVVAFHAAAWHPDGATLIVVGDTTPAEAESLVVKALGAWPRGAQAELAELPDPPPAAERTIYLIDRPGSAQSVIAVSQIGIPRSAPDYFPAVVLNSAFGGMFTSRINMNLREDKGYTYGARSAWSFRRGAGPFTVSAPVQTQNTKESVAEILKEIDALRGPRPVTEQELAFAKSYLVRVFPQRFETPEQIADRFREVVLYRLPLDFFAGWVGQVEAVTVADVQRVAAQRLDPAHLAIVVVGDAAVVRPGLEQLGAGPVVELDAWGAPRVASR